MKCVLKAKCSKEIFLDNALLSSECKYKDGYTYGWYLSKRAALDDKISLSLEGIEAEVITGWDIDGFVTFR